MFRNSRRSCFWLIIQRFRRRVVHQVIFLKNLESGKFEWFTISLIQNLNTNRTGGTVSRLESKFEKNSWKRRQQRDDHEAEMETGSRQGRSPGQWANLRSERPSSRLLVRFKAHSTDCRHTLPARQQHARETGRRYSAHALFSGLSHSTPSLSLSCWLWKHPIFLN